MDEISMLKEKEKLYDEYTLDPKTEYILDKAVKEMLDKNIDNELEVVKNFAQRKNLKESLFFEAVKEIYRKLGKEWTL